MDFAWEKPPDSIHVVKHFGIFRYDIDPQTGEEQWMELRTSLNENESSITIRNQPSGYRTYAVVSVTHAYLKDDTRAGVVTTPFGPGVMATVNVGGATAPPTSCTLSVDLEPDVAVPEANRSVRETGGCGGRLKVNAPSPTSLYVFTGWGAPCASIGTGACYALATENTVTVKANYTRKCTLAVSAGTGGQAILGSTGTRRWTGACGTQLSGTTAPTATAATLPAPGYVFKDWTAGPIPWTSGCGTSATCTPTVGSRTGTMRSFTLRANFTPQCTLNVVASPTTGGTVTGGWTGNCGTRLGASAAPTATAATGYRFTGWTGGCSGTGACTPTVGTAAGAPGTFSVTANFTRTYTLTTTASPMAGGTITGGGTYNSGTTVTVTTSPTAGYRFTGWSGDCTGTGTCTVAMNGNRSVTANFTRIRYTLTTTASPVGGGSVTGGGAYDSGTTAAVTATPATGYRFTNWSGDCSGTGTCTVVMNGSRSVTANFMRTYTLTATASPMVGGTITGGGTYDSGTTVTVTASANTGYRFTNWSGDCSGTGTCTVVMNRSRSVTANFTRRYVLTTSVSPAGGGSVTGGDTYDSGTTVTVTASANAGYRFTNWSGDCSGTGTCTVVMNRDRSVTANFTRRYVLTATASPAGGGSVTGGGTYDSGTTVTVTASANAGYRFTNWSGDCSGTGTCTVVMNRDRSVTANFTRRYVLTATASPAGGGSVTGGGTYDSGTRVTVRASANTGYRFTNWSGDCSGTGTCTVVMNRSRSVTANFTRRYVLTTSASPAGGGSVSGGGAYNSGTRVTVRASANTGYQFSRWSGACSGTGACSVLMNANKAVRAHFTVKACRVSATVGRGGGGTVSTSPTSGAVQCGTGSVTVRAQVSSGYCFWRWGGGLGVTGQAGCNTTPMPLTIPKPTTDVTVTAHFRPTLTISVNRVRNAAGSVSPGPGTYIYAYGTRVTITAAGAFGAVWTWGGACSGTGTCTVVMTQPRTVSVTFSPGVGGSAEEEEDSDEAETATATPSPSATATPSPTATATPSPTATATPSPSASATP